MAAEPTAPPIVAFGPVARGGRGDRTSDRVYEVLSQAIRTIHLLPGTALSESELAHQLQVSRTPLREAIARLVDHGLVQVTPQVGTQVSLIDMSQVEQAWFVREHLEVAAFTAACGLADRDVAPIRAVIRTQQKAARAKDLDAFFDADEAMHRQVFALAGYDGAWRAVHRMKMHLDRLRRLSLPDPATLRALIAEHVGIIDALEADDVASGTQLIRVHVRRVTEQGPGLRQRYPDYFSD